MAASQEVSIAVIASLHQKWKFYFGVFFFIVSHLTSLRVWFTNWLICIIIDGDGQIVLPITCHLFFWKWWPFSKYFLVAIFQIDLWNNPSSMLAYLPMDTSIVVWFHTAAPSWSLEVDGCATCLQVGILTEILKFQISGPFEFLSSPECIFSLVRICCLQKCRSQIKPFSWINNRFQIEKWNFNNLLTYFWFEQKVNWCCSLHGVEGGTKRLYSTAVTLLMNFQIYKQLIHKVMVLLTSGTPPSFTFFLFQSLN